MGKKDKEVRTMRKYISGLENGEYFMVWTMFRCLVKQVGWCL